jgi:hypothetical protein
MESTWDPDLKVEKKMVIHHVLTVQKREISLPVGSETARVGDLGLVSL